MRGCVREYVRECLRDCQKGCESKCVIEYVKLMCYRVDLMGRVRWCQKGGVQQNVSWNVLDGVVLWVDLIGYLP